MPLMRRRRPLLRAAAVGGGAYMAGKARARSQDQQQAEAEPAYAEPPPQQAYAEPPPPAPGGMNDDTIARLQQLGQLHEQGVLTDEEFAAQKAKILG